MASAVTAAPLRSRRRYPDGDLAIKLRVSHLVESVDFEPRELPPAAVLIVRRFADPMPRCLRSDASALVPTPAWERAARSGLADIARQAARPAHNAVPSNANAVLFADEAELLACFSRDLLRGEASLLWWWRALLRSLPSAASRSLLDAWRRDVRYVPAALAHLSTRGDALWVLSSFTPAQAWTVLEDVARAFELEFVSAAVRGPSNISDKILDAAIRGTIDPDNFTPVATPWERFLTGSAVPPSLGRERSALLGVSLVLHRSSTIARSQQFAQAFVRWYQSEANGLSYDATTQGSRTAALTGSMSQPLAASSATELPSGDPADAFVHSRFSNSAGADRHASERVSSKFDLLPEPDPTRRTAGPLSNRDSSRLQAQTPGIEETQMVDDASRNRALAPGLDPQTSRAVDDVAELRFCDVTTQPSKCEDTIAALPGTIAVEGTSTSVADIQKSLHAGECVSTELGGVFFLVNVLQALRLPRSIEQECNCRLGLGSWELIELMARCLLGSSHADLALDPVWPLLSVLDGRPAEQKAGANFVSTSSYRIPASLIPDDVTGGELDGLAIRIRGRRLEFWNPLGFPQMVRYFDEPPSRSMIEEEIGKNIAPFGRRNLRRYSRWPTGAEALDLTLDRPLRVFLGFLLPFLRWRLVLGLGLRTTRKPDFAEALLLRAARVWVTSTHVDLMMSLNQATTPVRWAGLDADPGWVPELGRVVKFHFD